MKMGKTFINKLGSLLRVFKSSKKREFGKENEDFADITSESGIRTSESSSCQQSDIKNRTTTLKISKSTESSVIGTVGNGTIGVNELKRSHGTCDILSSNKEEEVKCTKSLNGLCPVPHKTNCVFSYYAKLHDSTIWSRAVGRIPLKHRPMSRKSENSSSSTIQVDDRDSCSKEYFANALTRNEETVVNFQEIKIDKAINANSEFPKVVDTHTDNILNPYCTNGESDEKVHVVLPEETCANKENEDQAISKRMGLSHRNKDPSFPSHICGMNRKIYVLEEVEPLQESSLDSERTERPKIIVDEQNLQVKMDLKTIKNEQGFDLLKYDVKSSGDHASETRTLLEDFVNPSNSTDVIIDQTSYESEVPQENIVNSSKLLSNNTTDYEVVNTGQVDLFEEFRTTISKMRNVLNVLEVKKSLHGETKCNLSENKKKGLPVTIHKGESISTQTDGMTSNQMPTSTDSTSCDRTRNEGIMVQLSSETTTKCKSNVRLITLNKNLIEYMKPLTKTRRRRKRGCRCRHNRVTKKAINSFSSSQDGQLRTKMKPGKPQYNKCVVYHITQHKNAVDRGVGPCPSRRGKMILQNTFSALHFGPINEFPKLLNKREHENEKKKKKEEREKRSPTIQCKKDQSENICHRTKSTSFLSSEVSKCSNETGCLKSKTQPSLKCMSSKNYSSFSTSTATTNWVVFQPSPPLVLKNTQSTSDDLLLNGNGSSQQLVSNILEEELKTSGLKGRISSSTMNLIKDQFCDKLNGLKTKDAPDVMITVCVPLKNIVSKIKTSKKAKCEDKTVSFTNDTTDSNARYSPSISEKGIQVDICKNYVNDNLQIIPEKMSRKSTEIYQHNKQLRENMSSKRLSTFKKIFGNKSTSCSNINPFGHIAQRTSKIYFSDHSTSSPNFATNPVYYAHKKNLTTPNSSSFSISREESRHHGKNKREGFFLNLPSNNCRKKREQISKLFDGSDYSDRRYFERPKLLYHVHDSSFYSTSKTDDRLSSGRILLEASASNDYPKMSYIPVQQVSSGVDINVKPKYVSFCDLPRKCNSQAQTSELVREKLTQDCKNLKLTPKTNRRNVDVNTSDVKFFLDNETQIEIEGNVFAEAPVNEKSSTNKKTWRAVPTENFFNNSMDEFSVMSLPKVHFKDEIDDRPCSCKHSYVQNDVAAKRDNIQIRPVETNKEGIHRQLPRKSVSVHSQFSGDIECPGKRIDNVSNEEMGNMRKDKTMVQPKRSCQIHSKIDALLQTSSESNINRMNRRESGVQIGTVIPDATFAEKETQKRSKDIVRMMSTQIDNSTNSPKKENCLVQVEAPNATRNESRLTVLIRDIVNLCNSSFVKSRDCIVELTLYNLIKEIIMEHCSHLSEQSRQRIELVLANFIELSKQKSGNQDIQIVESAIENLVKEIGPTDIPVNMRRDKCGTEFHPDEDYNQDMREDHEHKRNGAHSRSKCKHRGHKHESKHRSHHREAEVEYRERRHHREQRRHENSKHHKHHCDDDGRCDMGREDFETNFQSIDGKREYLELVQRLQELEELTKQLSNVAHNQQNQLPHPEVNDTYQKHKNLYTEYLFMKPKFTTKKKIELRELKRNCKEYKGKPLRVNYFQTELKQSFSPTPRQFSKLPVTKIIINLSNLKLLTRNCVSLMSTSIKEPIVFTDSTEEKRELMNKIVSYEINDQCRGKIRHSSKHTEKIRKNHIQGTMSEVVDKNKESFTITIHGKDKRKKKNAKDLKAKSSKSDKDYMRIKMVRKKKTVTSSDPKSSDSAEKKITNSEKYDLHEITKEFIKKEYKLKSDNLCSNIANDLLEKKCNVDQVLDYKGNLDLAYQRMANFCLFRGLLRKY